MDSIKLIKSQKCGRKIIFNNFIYNFSSQKENYITWRCNKRGCSGRIKTDAELKNIIFQNEHWHENEFSKIIRLEFNGKIKNIAVRTNLNFDNALISATEGMKKDDLIKIGNLNNIRDYFIKSRKSINELPKNENDNILEMYKYTFDNNIFLQYSDLNDGEKLMIFITNENLNILSKSKVWLGDGTFYTAPKNYSQIYIIHGLYFGKILPLCYILMKNKREKSYKKIFDYFIANISTEPEHFIVDFEISQHNAIKKTFKNTKISG
ncbi:hypothetical protein DMUE_3363 [Dictyocoela muelleri]|nr:hypothetical protein DMUE_3363 [Dictyocoela muelleri]